MSTAKTRQLAERRVGKTLDGKWRLDAMLGFGGSAAVYAATHRNGKRAAVKVLHPQAVADENLRSRFVREGYVANKIGHPGAVSVLDDDVADDGTVYIVMELLEGMSLERRGRGELPPMSLPEVLRVADDLLDVLAHAHAAGIVHRDIKPANVFVTKAGELKVLDFGIARLAEPTLEGSTQTGFMMGTPAYMAPEQARARWDLVDARADLWAVGATMLALLLGHRPRVAETANEELLLAMTQPLPPASVLVPGLPPDIATAIDRAVSYNRDERFADAHTMRAALRVAAGIGPSERFEVSLASTVVSEAPVAPHTVVTGPQAPSAPPVGPPTPRFHEQQQPQSWGTPFSPASAPPSFRYSESPSTSSRALSHSHGPQAPVPSRGAVWIAIAAMTVLLVTGLGLLLRVKQAPAQPTMTTEPLPPPAATLPAVTANVPEEPPAASTASAEAPAPSATPSARPAAKTHPPASANPAKYFDSRF